MTCCGAHVNGWALAPGLAAENPTPAETDFPYRVGPTLHARPQPPPEWRASGRGGKITPHTYGYPINIIIIHNTVVYILLLLRREGELCSLHRLESFLFLSLCLSLYAFAFSANSLYCVSLCYVSLCYVSLCYVSRSAISLCYLSLLCLALLCVSLSVDFLCRLLLLSRMLCLSVCLSACLYVCLSVLTLSLYCVSLC